MGHENSKRKTVVEKTKKPSRTLVSSVDHARAIQKSCDKCGALNGLHQKWCSTKKEKS